MGDCYLIGKVWIVHCLIMEIKENDNFLNFRKTVITT